jgi:hypothetical protein
VSRAALIVVVVLVGAILAPSARAGGGPPPPDLSVGVSATPGGYALLTGRVTEPIVTLSVTKALFDTAATSTPVRVCAEASRPVVPFALSKRCLWTTRSLGASSATLSQLTGFRITLLAALSAPIALTVSVPNPNDRGRTWDTGGASVPIRIR